MRTGAMFALSVQLLHWYAGNLILLGAIKMKPWQNVSSGFTAL